MSKTGILVALLSASLSAAEFQFDKDVTHRPPVGFTSFFTGKGAHGAWIVVQDPTAPSAPNVLTQTNTDATSYRFPLCIADSPTVADVEASVKFKAVAGKEDQGAGIVWRFQDANNYYVVRANALENNLVLYKVQEGKRSDLKPIGANESAYGKKTEVPTGTWHTLTVRARGPRFEVVFNGKTLFEVQDTTFTKPGRTGLWTKADSLMLFDDFTVKQLR